MRSLVAAIGEHGHTRRTKTAAIGAFAFAFPCGTAMGSTLYDGKLSSRHWGDRIHVCRIVVAGLLVHRALFQLAPPHTHARLANMTYIVAFVAGLAMTAAVDHVRK